MTLVPHSYSFPMSATQGGGEEEEEDENERVVWQVYTREPW